MCCAAPSVRLKRTSNTPCRLLRRCRVLLLLGAELFVAGRVAVARGSRSAPAGSSQGMHHACSCCSALMFAAGGMRQQSAGGSPTTNQPGCLCCHTTRRLSPRRRAVLAGGRCSVSTWRACAMCRTMCRGCSSHQQVIRAHCCQP